MEQIVKGDKVENQMVLRIRKRKTRGHKKERRLYQWNIKFSLKEGGTNEKNEKKLNHLLRDEKFKERVNYLLKESSCQKAQEGKKEIL